MKTASDLVSRYLKHVAVRVRAGDLTEDVGTGYQRDLNIYCQQFGMVLISELRQHDLTALLEAHPSWKAVQTQRRQIAAVLACFRWAAEEELIPSCPYRSPRSLRGKIAETRRPATHEEFARLMAVSPRPLKLGLLFLYRTGCRTCEMRELTWDCVRIDGPQQPHLFLSKHKTVRKTGKPRIVGLDPLAVRLLRAIRRTTKSTHVFTNCDGNPWKKNTWCHLLRRTAQRFGLDDGVLSRITAYCLRHTYACDGIEAGFTEDQVAHQLGNSAPVVRRIYSRHVGQKVAFIGSVASGIGKGRK